jgi:hypothetical protein
MMTTNCTNCGAPLEMVFGRVQERCSYCGTTQQAAPAAARPGYSAPGPYVPPPPMMAPVYVAPRKQGSAGCVVGILALVMVLMVAAGAMFFFLRARPEASTSRSRDRNSSERPSSRSKAEPASAPAPAGVQGNYFQSATAVRDAIAARFTPNAEMRELVLYPEYAIFELRDPVKRNNVDRLVLRPGGFDDPDPIQLVADDKSELDKVSFRLSEVNFTVVPGLVTDALNRIKLDEGRVSHIIIDKFFPFRKALGFRVYVTSERDSGGYVSYDAAGRMLKVQD